MNVRDKNIDIIEQTKEAIHSYYCDKNWENALEYIDKDTVSWIGVSERAEISGYNRLKELFQRECKEPTRVYIEDETYQKVVEQPDYAVVYARVKLKIEGPDQENFTLRQRITIVYNNQDGVWKAEHIHVSIPSSLIENDNYFPRMSELQQYEQIKKMLWEKSQQIEMINRTQAGGMKGSLDDENYTYFYVNDELCSMLGYTYEEFMEKTGGTAVGAVYPPDLEKALKDCEECFAKGAEYKTEYRIRKKDGSLLWVMDSGRKVTDENGVTRIHSIITDISELKEAVNQLEIERERYEIVSELTDDIIFEYDVETDMLQIFYPSTPYVKKIKRVIEQAYYGGGAEYIGIHPDDYDRFYKEIGKVLQRKEPGVPAKVEYRIRRGCERRYSWRRVLMRCVFDTESILVKVVGKVVDISSERELVKRSVTDTLTGAYNRSYVKKAAEAYMQSKSEDVSLACMLVDLDYFKEINDNLGHLTGDRVLIDLVEIIRKLFRTTDIVARLGGDEFMLLMKDIYTMDIVKEKAAMLLKEVNDYGKAQGFPIEVSLSIGISVINEIGLTFENMYQQADIALYTAKHNGRNQYVIYDKDMKYPVDTST